MTAASVHHAQIPADRLFWSLVDAPGVTSGGPLPEALWDEVAEDIPVPSAELFAVAAPAHEGKLLVCAARRADLAGIPGSPRTLCPDLVPAQFETIVDPRTLNLLVGEFEPLPFRRARMRRHLVVSALLLLASVFLTVGLARRAGHAGAVADAARTAAGALVAETLPGQTVGTALLALDHEIARLRRAAQSSGGLAPPQDASVHLAGLLSSWPARVPSKPQSLNVSPGSISASVALEGDPAEFLAALHPPPGWTLEEPRMNRASGLTRVSLQMKPASIADSTPRSRNLP